MWILTGGDDQVHLRRLVLEQKRKSLLHWFGINQMVVVKDEDELLAHGRDLVQEHGQERLGGRRLGGFERSQHPCSDTGRDGLQGCHEVSQKAGGVVIPCVQRQPGNRKDEGLGIDD